MLVPGSKKHLVFWELQLMFSSLPPCRAAAGDGGAAAAAGVLRRDGAHHLPGARQAAAHRHVAAQRPAAGGVATPPRQRALAARAGRGAAGRRPVPVHGGERRGQLAGVHAPHHRLHRCTSLVTATAPLHIHSHYYTYAPLC